MRAHVDAALGVGLEVVPVLDVVASQQHPDRRRPASATTSGPDITKPPSACSARPPTILPARRPAFSIVAVGAAPVDAALRGCR